MRNKKIRILHVAQAAGGVDRYIRMLLKYLDKEKFENILVCSQDFHEEDYRGLVDSFEQVEMIRAIGGNDLKAIKEVRTLIKKYNPDIVYAHSSKAGAIARIADIGLKNHCVYNPHGWAFNMRCSAKKKAIYTMIEKIAAPFCDKIICISDAEKQSALDKKICKEDKLQVIFNGVDKLVKENKELGTVLAENLQGALPAIALDGHPALSTAYMNDCEPLLCFAQQVNGYGKAGDVFLGISTSGNSKNVLYAAITAHAKGMKVIGLTGAKNSKLEQMSDVCIKVPQTETYMIQELHMPVYHCLCLMLEDGFFLEK